MAKKRGVLGGEPNHMAKWIEVLVFGCRRGIWGRDSKYVNRSRPVVEVFTRKRSIFLKVRRS